MNSKDLDTNEMEVRERYLFRLAALAGLTTATRPSDMASVRPRKPLKDVTAPAAVPT